MNCECTKDGLAKNDLTVVTAIAVASAKSETVTVGSDAVTKTVTRSETVTVRGDTVTKTITSVTETSVAAGQTIAGTVGETSTVDASGIASTMAVTVAAEVLGGGDSDQGEESEGDEGFHCDWLVGVGCLELENGLMILPCQRRSYLYSRKFRVDQIIGGTLI